MRKESPLISKIWHVWTWKKSFGLYQFINGWSQNEKAVLKTESIIVVSKELILKASAL